MDAEATAVAAEKAESAGKEAAASAARDAAPEREARGADLPEAETVPGAAADLPAAERCAQLSFFQRPYVTF